jgi:hypothetical protein
MSILGTAWLVVVVHCLWPLLRLVSTITHYWEPHHSDSLVSCIQVGLLGVSVKDKTAYVWDDGNMTFTATAREHIAIAVRSTLLKPAETANRILHISSVECSMNDILATSKKIAGSENWAVTYCDSTKQIAQAKHDRQHGETDGVRMMALGRLALLVNLREECEPNYQMRGVLDNELLDIPQLPFEAVLRQAFAGEGRA